MALRGHDVNVQETEKTDLGLSQALLYLLLLTEKEDILILDLAVKLNLHNEA